MAFRALERLRKIERQISRFQEWQAEHAPPPVEPAPEPTGFPLPAPESTEDRFWAFFERVNPHLIAPRHFTAYVRQVLLAVGGDLRLVFAAPPQHGKTEVTLALVAFLVLEHPGKRWAYVTYSQKRANTVSRKFRRLMASAGHVCGGTLAVTYLPGGGQLLFTSIDGGITGEPVDGAAWIDDPYKNRKEADSQQRRQVVEDTYREAIETRVHPGASLFVLATRWHPEDLSGKLTDESAEEPFEYINLRAIAEGPVNDNGVVLDDPLGRKVGEPLFPEKWPLDALQKKKRKVLDFAWDALYQGRPRPKGGKVFHEPTFFTRLPLRYAGGYGLDLGYTDGAGDWSICAEVWREDRSNDEPLFYLVRVDRQQVEAADFALTLRAAHVRRPRFRMYWRASGTEKGAASFLIRRKLPIVVTPPPGGKLVAATEFATAWNDGRFLVPDPDVFNELSGLRVEEWLYPFLDVVRNFTGAGDEKDDDVDAAGNVLDALIKTVTGAYSKLKAGRKGLPKPRD